MSQIAGAIIGNGLQLVGNVLSTTSSGGTSGSGSTYVPVISDTYLNLDTLVNTSGLTVGTFYLITDHVTKHVIPNTTVINTGNLEPLILLATSTNKFDNLAYSTVYPEDIIHFDFNSKLCEDNTTPRTGKITYRKDKFNNSCFYDFRTVKFRRWSVDCSVNWVSGTNYTKNDLVKYNNIIYQVTTTTNSSNTTTPDQDMVHYVTFLKLTNTSYWAWTNNKNIFNIGSTPNKTNLILNSASTYIDCYTFDNGSGQIVNGTIYSIYNNEIKPIYFNMNYNNIVFIKATAINNNTIEYSSMYNTISDGFIGNIIGTNFNGNIIGSNFNGNIIVTNFNENIIGEEYKRNIIYGTFQSNTIGNDFNRNTIENAFQYNTIGKNFASNTIGNNFNWNTIVNNFASNTIGKNFASNTIGKYFNFNTIGNYFNSNTIGNYFNSNTIEIYIVNMNFINTTYNNHIYSDYNTTILSSSGGSIKVEYIDSNSILTIVDADGTEHKMGGGVGGGLISDIYDNIATLVNNNQLVVGNYYQILDYVTTHIIPNTFDINTGNLEPLILLATSTNKFDNLAYSTIYPDDTIHFDFNDNLCEDYLTPRTGKIIYRKDKFNNSTFYDFRNVKFRRWSVDCSVSWVSGSIYSTNELIKYNNIIYQVTTTTNSGNTTSPNNDSSHYVQFLDLTTYTYWSWIDDKDSFIIGNQPDKTNLIISSYIDCYTFDDGAGNIVINNYDNEIKSYASNSVEYNNIVFFGSNNHSNTIEYGSIYNTIGNNFQYNTIGNNFLCNIIGNGFNRNAIGNDFNYNTIGNGSQSNTIGVNTVFNTIGNNFQFNTIGYIFQYNYIGNDFAINTIVNYFYVNTIGNSFNRNTIQGNISINFTSATHVYNTNYNKTIFKGSNGNYYLSYFDGTTMVYVAANA